MYDASDPCSFDSIPRWFEEVNSYATPDTHRMIIGNKSDLKRTIEDYDDVRVKEFAEAHGVSWLETSAKQNLGISEAFESLSRECIEKFPHRGAEKSTLPRRPVPIPAAKTSTWFACSIL